jgi:hypothetical protein
MVANLTTVLLAGFGTDRLRRSEEAMKTADRENPTAGPECPATEHMVSPGQNRSCSFKWAAKQENFQPPGEVFFLDFCFYRSLPDHGRVARHPPKIREALALSNLLQLGVSIPFASCPTL